MVGGALATAGDLVFTGEGNGYFNAYDAGTGEQLWRYKSDFGVNAPPVSYAVHGKQYIAVAAGGNSLFNYAVGDEILVFSLESE
jgi:glucose dehydrogenase